MRLSPAPSSLFCVVFLSTSFWVCAFFSVSLPASDSFCSLAAVARALEPCSCWNPGSSFQGKGDHEPAGKHGHGGASQALWNGFIAPSLWERTESPGAVWTPRVEHMAQQGDRGQVWGGRAGCRCTLPALSAEQQQLSSFCPALLAELYSVDCLNYLELGQEHQLKPYN